MYVTRPINAHTHRAPYLLNGKAYELQTWYTDGGRRPASATGAMTLKVKVARSREQSEPSWPNAVAVSLEAGAGIPCQSNLAATLLVIIGVIAWSTLFSRIHYALCVANLYPSVHLSVCPLVPASSARMKRSTKSRIDMKIANNTCKSWTSFENAKRQGNSPHNAHNNNSTYRFITRTMSDYDCSKKQLTFQLCKFSVSGI